MAGVKVKKFVVTGASGLLGWHTSSRLHAANCAARYRNEVEPIELVTLSHETFDDDKLLDAALTSADIVLHFAGLNRGSHEEVEAANPAIARRIAASIERTHARPHVVYANSTHSASETPYGRSKKHAAEILKAAVPSMTDLVLPHIFGECARPYYNNVTATLIDQLWRGEQATINPDGEVELLHAGSVANIAIAKGMAAESGTVRLAGRPMTIVELYSKLTEFHRCYQSNVFPILGDAFDLALFNTYRTGGYPHYYPLRMKINCDARGVLFESAKSMGGSQTFLSTTQPGKIRGDHFHTDLVERFLVVSGEATIRIRKVLTNEVQSFRVSGSEPVAIDMPPLHTHHIVNDGDGELITFFWAHRHFNPDNPDTFADPVLRDLSCQ
jgi:UDP-2-acetamido-2,6-beta-L-arabino-hexul-4-ose reductase